MTMRKIAELADVGYGSSSGFYAFLCLFVEMILIDSEL